MNYQHILNMPNPHNSSKLICFFSSAEIKWQPFHNILLMHFVSSRQTLWGVCYAAPMLISHHQTSADANQHCPQEQWLLKAEASHADICRPNKHKRLLGLGVSSSYWNTSLPANNTLPNDSRSLMSAHCFDMQ